MTADVTREPTGGQELREALAAHRMVGGSHLGVDCGCGWLGRGSEHEAHVADAVLALPELAALLADADNWRRLTTGDPTEPEPLAMQARTLLLRVRELEAQVARVRGVEKLFGCDPDTPCRTTWREEPGFEGETYRIECCEVPMDDLRRALDGEPQP